METIKIGFVDFWPEIKDEDIFTPILKKHFNVIIDNRNPDVIFHSIFGGMQNTPKYRCKKILFLGENHRAKSFNSDFSISFDPTTDTNFRLPLWQYFILLKPEYKKQLFNRINYKKFDRFCSFVVSNPGNFIRNSFFMGLNSYKRVNSYGRYMRNSHELYKLTNGKYWRDVKDEFFKKYTHKFAITFENNSYPQYCTEKIMDGFLSGSIPIYWGDPKIHEEFNPKAFINTTNIDEIKKIDRNPFLFERIYEEPVFTNKQKDKLINNLGEFEHFIIKILKK